MLNNITKARELKESAKFIIDDVFYTGSYFLDLMAWEDIDAFFFYPLLIHTSSYRV